MTMFPLVSEAHARGDRFHRIFLTSLLFTITLAGVAAVLFSFFPRFILRLLIGSQYLSAAPYLATFSIFLSLCAVINLFTNFFLSIHRTKVSLVVLIGAIIQAILIVYFHSTIQSVITISLSVTSILTSMLFLYYIYVARR